MTIIDIHSHDHDATNALLCLSPDEAANTSRPCSVGIHPWDSDKVTDTDRSQLVHASTLPHVLAIGETGLDTMHGSSLDSQMALLRLHITLAKHTGKPLIIHLVRALEPFLAVWRDMSPIDVPAVIHGFRGKPQMAQQLLKAGFWLSFGPRFNPTSLSVTPIDRRLFETDDSGVPIAQVLTSADTTPQTAADNARRFLNGATRTSTED